MLEQFGPQEVVGYSAQAEAARLQRRHGRRPLPAVGPPAGPRRVRLERADRDRRAHQGRRRPGRHLPVASGCTRRSSPRRRRRSRRCTRAATGSASARGEALNEHVVGGYWPETPERINRMFEAIEIIKKLFAQPSPARTSSTRASTSSSRPTRLWTMPEARRRRSTSRPPGRSPPRRPASTPTGLITVGAPREKLEVIFEKCEEGCREAGKDPRHDAEVHPAAPPVLGADRRGGAAERDDRVAERRHEVPQAGHPLARSTSSRWPSSSGPRTSRAGC